MMPSHNYQPIQIDIHQALIPHIPVAPDLLLAEAILVMSRARGQSCTRVQSENKSKVITLQEEPSSCVLIVEENGYLVGILTEYDFVKFAAQQLDLTQVTVGEVMTSSPIVLQYKDLTDLFFAYNLMRRHNIRHLPVVDDLNHPLGVVSMSSLRQTLNLTYFLRFRRISEVMNYTPIVVTPDLKIINVAQMMERHHISSVIVIDHQSVGLYPIGIVTERDIVQLQSLGLDLQTLTVVDIMSTPLFCLSPETSLAEAQLQMEMRRIRRIPIIDSQGELVGILSQSNLTQVLDPMEVYGIVEILHHRVSQLELARLQLLQSQENNLTKGLQCNEFELYYQPQYNLNPTGDLHGAEALLRWKHPNRGYISPNEFLPLAESTGFIVQLGEWVLRQSCLQMVSWKQQESATFVPPESLSVNVSSSQLDADDFVEMFERILTETGCRAEWITIELTESTLVNDVGATVSIFQRLHQLGSKIAIDDFGSGYASLGYVQHFPFDILKIDRDFIQGIDLHSKTAMIASSIIQMAHRLELCVIAEGVETEAERDFLVRCNCDVAQGFLYGRPEPPADVIRHFVRSSQVA
jgi:EAL domain-containing protein (putative c-di-GMP-specific phosphodiesterase class I)/CBS domain-containing protein